MVIFFPLLLSLIGALMYIILDAPPPNNAKLSTLGLQMFWVGLLVFLLQYHGQPISVR